MFLFGDIYFFKLFSYLFIYLRVSVFIIPGKF